MNRRESLKLMLGSAALAASGLLPTVAFAQGTAQGTAPAAQTAADGPFKLPKLPYPFEALEPHIDAQTMMIHHDKHHAAYVNALNGFAQRVPELGTTPIEKTLQDTAYVPLQIQQQVKNNLGGHWNHTFFWELMTPGGAKEPSGDLKTAIDTEYGGLDKLKERLNEAAAARFGSGWAWLIVNRNKKLEITSSANQDTPIEVNVRPVLGVDVWEHAYYLKYQNRRADYLKAWWNVVNWDKATENFKTSKV
jgi:superoxide dismutase, Fe-Mn family